MNYFITNRYFSMYIIGTWLIVIKDEVYYVWVFYIKSVSWVFFNKTSILFVQCCRFLSAVSIITWKIWHFVNLILWLHLFKTLISSRTIDLKTPKVLSSYLLQFQSSFAGKFSTWRDQSLCYKYVTYMCIEIDYNLVKQWFYLPEFEQSICSQKWMVEVLVKTLVIIAAILLSHFNLHI